MSHYPETLHTIPDNDFFQKSPKIVKKYPKMYKKPKISKILKKTSKTSKKYIGTHFEHFWKKKFWSDFSIFDPVRHTKNTKFYTCWEGQDHSKNR